LTGHFQAAFSSSDAMFSENDSQELKVDLAEKSARQRPPSNQEVGFNSALEVEKYR